MKKKSIFNHLESSSHTCSQVFYLERFNDSYSWLAERRKAFVAPRIVNAYDDIFMQSFNVILYSESWYKMKSEGSFHHIYVIATGFNLTMKKWHRENVTRHFETFKKAEALQAKKRFNVLWTREQKMGLSSSFTCFCICIDRYFKNCNSFKGKQDIYSFHSIFSHCIPKCVSLSCKSWFVVVLPLFQV